MTGAILAGGHGRRMGRDKALLPWEGGPLWQRQVAVLREAGASPVAVVRREDQCELGDLCWRDRRVDCGPLAGLEIALERSEGAALVAVLAVDMPGIEPAWYRWLLGHCREGGGAVARHSAGFEPLAAIYPSLARAEVSARLDRGEFALQPLVAALVAAGQMTVVMLPAEREGEARSLNSPEHLR